MSDRVLEVERPEQLKALGHPLRLKVLQTLGQTEAPLTNRELAARLEVDPGHLHFHVRMLARAGLIEAVPGRGREKPYRPVAERLRIGPELRAAGLASDVQAAQLEALRQAFEQHGATGGFRTVQVHARVDVQRLRELFDELIDRLIEAERDELPQQTLLIAYHPSLDGERPG